MIIVLPLNTPLLSFPTSIKLNLRPVQPVH
ncbi:Uncharacterised protein [Vibrio cholerae]|nr:Uncharacterised protein [Vibrio cholerae]